MEFEGFFFLISFSLEFVLQKFCGGSGLDVWTAVRVVGLVVARMNCVTMAGGFVIFAGLVR